MKLPSFTLVPQLDRSPRWVAFAQTIPGKLSLVMTFAGLLFLHDVFFWWLISLYLTIFSLWPGHRWEILFTATWSFLWVAPIQFEWERFNALFLEAGIQWQIDNTVEGLPLILSVIVCIALLLWLVRKSITTRYVKRPILTLICLYLGLMLAASYAPLLPALRAFLWALLVIFGKYFWYTCYSLKECRARNPASVTRQLGQYLPFWSPNVLPYPKGSGYLQRIEAKTTEEFAICQIKGLKLLMWALWLKLFAVVIEVTLYGYGELLHNRLQFKRELGMVQLFLDGNYLSNLFTLPFSGLLPRYEIAFNLAANGSPLPWHINWFSLVADFLYVLLSVALSTHIIISIIRMCGFKALRNTYRPLASRTIAEFWNRYFYYFKELLVEFFFYPVFFRYFKNRPLLRKYTATMAAAFFGNFLFHFILDIWYVVELGFFEAMIDFHSYFVYCFILGNVIFLSQWRQEKVNQLTIGPVSRFFAPVRVLGFYCLLSILIGSRRESISDNISFFLSLSPF